MDEHEPRPPLPMSGFTGVALLAACHATDARCERRFAADSCSASRRCQSVTRASRSSSWSGGSSSIREKPRRSMTSKSSPVALETARFNWAWVIEESLESGAGEKRNQPPRNGSEAAGWSMVSGECELELVEQTMLGQPGHFRREGLAAAIERPKCGTVDDLCEPAS